MYMYTVAVRRYETQLSPIHFCPKNLDQQTNRQADKQTNTQTNQQINTQTHKQSDKQTNRETDKANKANKANGAMKHWITQHM